MPNLFKQTTKATFFLFWVLFWWSFFAQAQTTSLNLSYKDEVYAQMFKSYQMGDVQNILDIFKERCLEKGHHYREVPEFRSIRSRIRADIYELVIKAYLSLDMHDRAEFFMRKLFAIRYDDDFNDYWLAFRNAHEEVYYIAPNIMVGAYLGLNGTVTTPIREYAILEPMSHGSQQTYTKTYYRIPDWFNKTSMIGWHLGLHGEYGLSKNLSTNFRIQYNSYKFGYGAFNDWRNNLEGTGNRQQFVEYFYQHLHTVGYLQSYFGLQYRFVKHRIQPNIHIGGFYNRLFTAEKNISLNEKPGFIDSAGNVVYFTGNTVSNVLNIEKNLSNNYWGVSTAVGVGYRFDYFYLKVEGRYQHGLQNIIAPNARLEVDELVYGFHDLFDDLSIQNLELTFGIYVPLSYKSFRR